MKILVVEDDALILEVLHELLNSKGYELELAADGEQALLILNKMTFDLIVSDIQMPNLDGLQLAYKFREKDSTTPILFFSSVSRSFMDMNIELKKIGNAEFVEGKNFNILLDSVKKIASSKNNKE